MDMIGAHDHGATSPSLLDEVAHGSAAAYQASLVAAIVIAVTAGLLVSQAPSAAAAAAGADPELTRLLRMMALLKAMTALGAAALVAWRLGFPARVPVAAGYVTAAALMAAGPALMWGMTHIVAGGLVFHAGLVVMLGLGWRDGMRRVVERRR